MLSVKRSTYRSAMTFAVSRAAASEARAKQGQAKPFLAIRPEKDQ
jgi:hypothetical protein